MKPVTFWGNGMTTSCLMTLFRYLLAALIIMEFTFIPLKMISWPLIFVQFACFLILSNCRNQEPKWDVDSHPYCCINPKYFKFQPGDRVIACDHPGIVERLIATKTIGILLDNGEYVEEWQDFVEAE